MSERRLCLCAIPCNSLNTHARGFCLPLCVRCVGVCCSRSDCEAGFCAPALVCLISIASDANTYRKPLAVKSRVFCINGRFFAKSQFARVRKLLRKERKAIACGSNYAEQKVFSTCPKTAWSCSNLAWKLFYFRHYMLTKKVWILCQIFKIISGCKLLHLITFYNLKKLVHLCGRSKAQDMIRISYLSKLFILLIVNLTEASASWVLNEILGNFKQVRSPRLKWIYTYF